LVLRLRGGGGTRTIWKYDDGWWNNNKNTHVYVKWIAFICTGLY
jgi:hypothetical protein